MSGHFVERRFELGDDAEIVLRIAPPVSDGANFRCDYEVIWPDRTDRSSGFGVDGVQALLNALHSTRHNLMASDDFASGRQRVSH